MNFNKQLVELTFRLSRIASTDNDRNITSRLQSKVLQKAARFHLETPDCNRRLSIEQAKLLQKQVAEKINKKKDSAKRERIKNWKQKMIFGTKSKNVQSFVYKWIKSKTFVEVPNLIVDSNGNILYNPAEAIHEFNEQWDKVFAANVLHQEPLSLLKFVWPYLDEIRSETQVPTLDGKMLQQQLLGRKPNAAAGIDGWRTVETQSLPVFVLDQIAVFFREIEDGTRQMPKQLATAKQVLLNKNGLDNPMQKRIISLLPIFLLAYTGLRFRQLQIWQNNVFPRELKGGIKGRTMSEIPTDLRLCIDSAKQDKAPVVGIKLDKSKCFDKIVHSTAAVLVLSLGCPKNVVNFFMGIFSSLTRFLCYKQWCSDRPTTCANGVVQGCSFSILAINALMTVWCLFLRKIPHIQFAAYNDDSYIWAHLQHTEFLKHAFQVTELWDCLTGQDLNKKKCQAFATSTAARKRLKTHFPEVDHTHVVTVLGVNLNVTNNKNTMWPADKSNKIIKDLKSIRAIPCSKKIACHLIATKVIPQLNFMPSLSKIPKKFLQKVQDEIASTLWKNRPMWRSRWLVLGILATPHRSEPFLARAFSTVLETLNFLKSTDTCHRRTWERLVNSDKIQPNSLLASFLQACKVIGVSLISPFCLQIAGFTEFPLQILDFTKRDLKKLLCNLCRHQCYIRAGKTARKDVLSPSAFLDYDVTMTAHTSLKNKTAAGLKLTSIRDSTIVGCTVTHDRAFKAGLSAHSDCRFCGGAKETMHHLACECCAIPGAQPKPLCPDYLGPNFPVLGVAEVCCDQVKNRLQCSDPHSLAVQSWCHPDTCAQHLWTDGSCEFVSHYWYTTGGYAVVDSADNILFEGPVFHFALSSFSCELWSVLVAFANASNPLCIHSDCDSLVKMINMFPFLDSIPTDWPHFTWFAFLHHIYQIRKAVCDNPLVLEWCPSHILEDTPWFQISDEAARNYGTNVANIWHNRTADRAAKRAVKKQLVDKEVPFDQICCEAVQWQTWLVHIAIQVALSRQDSLHSLESQCRQVVKTPEPAHDTIPSVFDITPEHPLHVFQFFLPKWDWEPDSNLYTWTSNVPNDCTPTTYATISEANWQTAISFFKSLRWCIDDGMRVAYIELTYQFHHSGFRFEGHDSVAKTTTILRKVINQSTKRFSDFPLFVGQQKAGSISLGKTLPAGHIRGSRPLVAIQALKNLASVVLHGRSEALSLWDTPF